MGEITKWLLAMGGGGTLVAGIQAVLSRRKLGADTEKTEADAASVLSKTALELIQPLRERIHELERQLDRVKDKADDLEQRLDACQASNRAKDREITRLRAQPSI